MLGATRSQSLERVCRDIQVTHEALRVAEAPFLKDGVCRDLVDPIHVSRAWSLHQTLWFPIHGRASRGVLM